MVLVRLILAYGLPALLSFTVVYKLALVCLSHFWWLLRMIWSMRLQISGGQTARNFGEGIFTGLLAQNGVSILFLIPIQQCSWANHGKGGRLEVCPNLHLATTTILIGKGIGKDLTFVETDHNACTSVFSRRTQRNGWSVGLARAIRICSWRACSGRRSKNILGKDVVFSGLYQMILVLFEYGLRV